MTGAPSLLGSDVEHVPCAVDGLVRGSPGVDAPHCRHGEVIAVLLGQGVHGCRLGEDEVRGSDAVVGVVAQAVVVVGAPLHVHATGTDDGTPRRGVVQSGDDAHENHIPI